MTRPDLRAGQSEDGEMGLADVRTTLLKKQKQLTAITLTKIQNPDKKKV